MFKGDVIILHNKKKLKDNKKVIRIANQDGKFKRTEVTNKPRLYNIKKTDERK